MRQADSGYRRREGQFRLWMLVALVASVGCSTSRITSPVQTPAPATTARFASEIAAFEAADRTNPPPSNAVLFVGSSTIRRWPNLSADFPGIAVIQRGVGGSRTDEILHYAPQI